FNAAPHIYAYYLFSNGQLQGFSWQPIAIVECGLIISLSLLTLWKSRTAATLLFGYYIASRIFLFFHQDHFSMGPLFVMFIGAAIFFYAMDATYSWHSQYKHQDASK
ncbi:hypothetical protein, partial [Chromobacterium amazonense]|uniref:hypothetical protein n=1 Tax=Chromobacterium amazonense TaxID=1382803 RepID=UPI003F78F952